MNRRGFLKALGIAPAIPYVPALPVVEAVELDPMPMTMGADWARRYEWNDTMSPLWEAHFNSGQRI